VELKVSATGVYVLGGNHTALLLDTYGIKLPEGYVREGDRYVFKGEAKPAAPAAPISKPKTTTASAEVKTPAPTPAKARVAKKPPSQAAEAKAPITPAGATLEAQIERGEKVKAPKGATFLRTTHEGGKTSVTALSDIDTLANTGKISKAEWGNKSAQAGKKGEFVPMSKAEAKVRAAADQRHGVEQAQTAQAAVKPVSTKDVVDTLSKAFAVPIRVGRFRNRAAGIYKVDPEVARTKGYGDIATASHEVAHHLWNTTDVSTALPREVKAELRGLDYKPERANVEEGFAEFARHLLTKDDVTTVAPKTSQWFADSWLPANKNALRSFDDAKAKIDDWRRQGYVNSVIAQIEKPPSAFGGLRKLLQDPLSAWHKVVDTMYDRMGPLHRAQYAIAGTKNLADIPAEFRFGQAAKVFNMTAPAKAKSAVMTYMPDFMGNPVGKSLKEHLAPVLDQLRDNNTAKEFLAFLYSRHALDVIAQGKEPGITKEAAQFTVD
jgi:hypothetical protein